jgi:hypothetical protein
MKPRNPGTTELHDKGSDEKLGEPTTSTDWIGNGLRQLYQQVAEEPLPDAFRSLLEKLDTDSPGGGKERK